MATTVTNLLSARPHCDMAATVKQETHWYDVHTQPVARTTQTSWEGAMAVAARRGTKPLLCCGSSIVPQGLGCALTAPCPQRGAQPCSQGLWAVWPRLKLEAFCARRLAVNGNAHTAGIGWVCDGHSLGWLCPRGAAAERLSAASKPLGALICQEHLGRAVHAEL